MPAQLHHERIAHAGAPPVRWLLLTHGIYGAGGNLRSIARKVTERRLDWGVVLVDLRQHGRSGPGAPPHTIAACADDLRALIGELGDIAAIAGHSFGGKVVLATRPLVDAAQTWMLDASPGARPTERRDGAVTGLLDLMERPPAHWDRREDFVSAVVADGHDAGLASWLAMNLVPDPTGGMVLRFEVAALREMLADYYAADLWGTLETPGGDVEVVIAERADTFSAADRDRLAAAPPHVHVHRVAAGHWLHIDAPEAVVELFTSRLA